MPINRPKYVFRGTTIKYKGNKNSFLLPYTCTSTHPVKALWFGLECYPNNPETAVIYVARTENLKNIRISVNHFSSIEDEIAFEIPPIEFCRLSEGFMHVLDFQYALTSLGIECSNIVRLETLTKLCKETKPIHVNLVERLVNSIRPNLKK